MSSAHRALLLVAWVLVALSPTRSVAQELMRVPYGVTTSLQHLPILVGKDSGLFAKYGFNIEPIHIRGGALITTMIMSGTVQFSGAGAESVVAARIEGGDVALIACPPIPMWFILSRGPSSRTRPASKAKTAR